MPASPALRPEHLQGIGHVVTAWARLEVDMLRAFEALLETEFWHVVAVFWHMGFRDRHDRLLTLVHSHLEEDNPAIKECKALMKRVKTAFDTRNTVAHSVWRKGRKKDSIRPTRIVARGGPMKIAGDFDFPDRDFTADDFNKEAIAISSLNAEFKEFFHSTFGARFYEPSREPPN